MFECGAPDRHTFDQDLVRVLLTAVDRSLEGISSRAGQTVKDELLNLTLPVADHNRPAFVLLHGDVPADFAGPGFEQLGRVAHGDLLRYAADLELYIRNLRLRYPENRVLGVCSPKSGGGNANCISAGRQVRQLVCARVSRGSFRFYTGSRIDRCYRRAGNRSSRGIGTVPVMVPTGPCALTRAAKINRRVVYKISVRNMRPPEGNGYACVTENESAESTKSKSRRLLDQ